MLRKRLIFTLLYERGTFVLSRNFRLQQVGDVHWLNKNYNFSQISFYIDELIVLDVTREDRDVHLFAKTLRMLASQIFVPISVGGGILSVSDASLLFNSGADKIVLNTALFSDISLLNDLVSSFGVQSIVGSLDVLSSTDNSSPEIYSHNGSFLQPIPFVSIFDSLYPFVGELYLNSIDRDGTGQGYDFSILNYIPPNWSKPVIFSGGAGNSRHLIEGLKNPAIDACATAHLFNFIGDSLEKSREEILSCGIDLAKWPTSASLDNILYDN